MTAALEGGECSAARPGRTLPLGKTRYPFYRRLGGAQGRYGRVEILVYNGIRSRTVQPVVSRYTLIVLYSVLFVPCLALVMIHIYQQMHVTELMLHVSLYSPKCLTINRHFLHGDLDAK